MPKENAPESVECADEQCKSVFWRPQAAKDDDAQPAALSTADIAQLHGWTLIDREKGLLHCAWGHPKD